MAHLRLAVFMEVECAQPAWPDARRSLEIALQPVHGYAFAFSLHNISAIVCTEVKAPLTTEQSASCDSSDSARCPKPTLNSRAKTCQIHQCFMGTERLRPIRVSLRPQLRIRTVALENPKLASVPQNRCRGFPKPSSWGLRQGPESPPRCAWRGSETSRLPIR
jgi:hypothetical protein